MNSLFELPLDTLIVLASGYAACRLVYGGLKNRHKSSETIFLTVIFASIAKMILMVMTAHEINAVTGSGLAFLNTLAMAIFWKKWGQGWFYQLMRKTDVSWSDGTVSAWDSLRTGIRHRPVQLLVRKKDGKQLLCDDLGYFQNHTKGPCIYGEDGSIGMYVTHFRFSAKEPWEENEPEDQPHGQWIRYIPADEISEIKICHKHDPVHP